MRSPRKLLTFHTDPSTIAPPRVPTLVHAFQGFVDAGGGVRQHRATSLHHPAPEGVGDGRTPVAHRG